MARQTGETTRQMESAPKAAVFVWCNGALSYPKDLAQKLGRTDLKIVGPDWLTNGYWRGLELTGLVVDHATNFTGKLMDARCEALTRVRLPRS